MNSNAHIGEAAELYAAAALTAEERAAVDAHIGSCDECLRRVGEAEETVLALERVYVAPSVTTPARKVLPLPRRGVPGWWVAAAAAAALIIGFVLPHRTPQSDVATLAMLHSHFVHAQFTGTGPAAKVLYARDRSWYYVIVDGSHRYGVYGTRNGQVVDLGITQPKTETSELFAPVSLRLDQIELRDRGAVVETAAIR